MSGNESGYNDRALTEASDDVLPKPQIEIIADGNKIFKPGMKSYFVDEYNEDAGDGSFVDRIIGEYCTCDTVLSVHTVCTCEHVCTCENHCSCVGFTSTVPGGLGGSSTLCSCQSVSCGSPCACVPVH